MALERTVPVHRRWCSLCCMHKNDLCSLHRCWQGGPRKLSEWTKQKGRLCHRCFLSAQISPLLHLVIATIPLHFAIPGRFQRCRAGSNSTVKLHVLLQFLLFFWSCIFDMQWCMPCRTAVVHPPSLSCTQ